MPARILVIDDEPLVLSSIEKALSKVGYSVIAVKDAKGFRNAVSQGIDLIIMDLHLKGINTNDLIAEAKKHSPSVRFLIISGSMEETGSKNFLQKPFRINELREKVRQILNEPS